MLDVINTAKNYVLIHLLKRSIDCSYHTEEGVPISEVAIQGQQQLHHWVHSFEPGVFIRSE